MKILYDFQILVSQRYGGISRYFYELICKLQEKNDIFISVPCIGSINSYFESYFNKPSQTNSKRGLGIINRILTKFVCNKYDIIHPTYYNPYLLGRTKGKIVITVYDMIHELMPQYFRNDTQTVASKKKMIYGSDHIIAISQSTKNDILKLYPDIPEDKISVIYIGSNMGSISESPKIKLPDKYILFVGNRTNYKNFNTFFNGIKSILEQDSNMNLVCIGGGSFSDSERDMILGLEKQVIQHNANEALLAYAYKNAQCFVFPSLYEGFGIPTLEAFFCDCPVILSNTSSMPEVGGDAVVYINPNDPNDIEEKVRLVLRSDSLQNELRRKGKEQLKKFDWNDIANETLECYKNVLGTTK